ncbi:hypothetical protein OTU49_000751, partial [Cherax quadricarinatus]
MARLPAGPGGTKYAVAINKWSLKPLVCPDWSVWSIDLLEWSPMGTANWKCFAIPAIPRKWSFVVFTVLVVVLGMCPARSWAQDSSIKLRQGTVQGVVREASNREIYAYLGIPYALPPVGNLRFKPPQRHNGWNSTLYAHEMGAACPQPFLMGVQISEDCLTLNVWIPE